MRMDDDAYTANEEQQLKSILDAWMPIFNKFASKKAKTKEFFERFGGYMKSAHMDYPDITGETLIATARSLKTSAGSLDQWRPEELRALSHWAPAVYEPLACILNHIERTGIWPTSLLRGYTALVPKPGMSDDPSPTDFRPISVLSAVYRLWSRRRLGIALQWQEGWAHEQVWGCRPRRGAESMTMDIALELEADMYDECQLVGGISFDSKKAFDLVPVDTMLLAMKHRGAHTNLLRAMRGMYDGLELVFRLRGSCTVFWRASNGILQGCASSMIGLDAIVGVLPEIAESVVPEVTARTYADDASGVAKASMRQQLQNSIRRFHMLVKAFEDADGGVISEPKTFTSGDKSLRGVIHEKYDHCETFRLVGGSFTVRQRAVSLTELEVKRFEKWHGTICRLRHAPIPWKNKAKMFLATQAQALWGQGTHSFTCDVDYIKKIRSDIMRTMFKCDFYSFSVSLTFSLLLPPQLDPFFGPTTVCILLPAVCELPNRSNKSEK